MLDRKNWKLNRNHRGQRSTLQMHATVNGYLCSSTIVCSHVHQKCRSFHNDTNWGDRYYLQFQKKISGHSVCGMRVNACWHMKQNRFDQQSESKRFSVVPKCLRAGTILARASRLPSSLWSNVQSCCSGRRWSRQKTEPESHQIHTLHSCHSTKIFLSFNHGL